MAKKSSKIDLVTPMDMTPMIDCVFQLIIFLMIVVDLTQQDLEDLVLPIVENALADEDPAPNRPIVNIDQEGRVIIKRHMIMDPGQDESRKPLRDRLQFIARNMDRKWDEQAKKELPDNFLLLRADEFTDWFHLAKVMEDCAQEFIQIWKLELAVAESQETKAKREKR